MVVADGKNAVARIGLVSDRGFGIGVKFEVGLRIDGVLRNARRASGCSSWFFGRDDVTVARALLAATLLLVVLVQ